MSEPILVAVAWPYANAPIHVGNLTGSYLPADIFARYQRMRGRQVLMVSGSDAHGTPITLRADAEGVSPEQVYKRYHRGFLDIHQRVGITYDLFTSTHTANHFDVSQKIFLALRQNGYLYQDKQLQWYSETQKRFLPDRYVEGTCYVCGYPNARSDQCDNCGTLLDPTLLINPRSRIDGSTPQLRETEHTFIDLAKLQPQIAEFLHRRESYWRPNVLRQSLGQIETEGLHGRPITRDLDWGIPAPVGAEEGKRLYVWFEAVIGYLSASIEWSRLAGQPDGWFDWWHNPQAKSYYFIGKDNIPFHAIIWPGQLIGSGTAFDELMGSREKAPLVLPYDVPANEFMNLEGQKISGSRNWAVWVEDFLSRYDPDPLRYYLTMSMPETKDSDWSWEEFYHRNNDELVATWGNLAYRVLSFTERQFEARVPDPGQLEAIDQALLQTVEGGFESVGRELEAVHLRAALNEAMRLAGEVNRYLEASSPWLTLRSDRQAAARAIYTALCAINDLKVLLAPFLPWTSEELHRQLGYTEPLFGRQWTETQADALGEHEVLRYDGSPATGHWQPERLAVGQPIRNAKPLFRKLEESVVSQELGRLGQPSEAAS